MLVKITADQYGGQRGYEGGKIRQPWSLNVIPALMRCWTLRKILSAMIMTRAS